VLCKTAFSDDRSYFHRYSELTEEEAIETADGIWTRINLKNLVENILPTRRRAGLILTKGANHRINEISLRNV
jgi:type I pantothenate kinase